MDVRSEWEAEDVPFLRALIEAERAGEPGESFHVEQIARQAGLPPERGIPITVRLDEAGYIEARLNRGDDRIMSAWIVKVRSEARRVVGQWPSSDPYEALLHSLDQFIAQEQDEDKRSRLVKLRDSVVGAGRDVLVGVLSAVLGQVATGQ